MWKKSHYLGPNKKAIIWDPTEPDYLDPPCKAFYNLKLVLNAKNLFLEMKIIFIKLNIELLKAVLNMVLIVLHANVKEIKSGRKKIVLLVIKN